MADGVLSVLNRQYLKVRQQYRHLQAGLAYLSGQSLPETRFVLFGRGRSGTTALVSLLDLLPTVHCEGEILHDYVPFPYVHVLGRSKRCTASTYGCKILSYQVRDVQQGLSSPKDFLRTLHDRDGFRILYLRRSNLLRHALSNIRARRESFHEKKTDAPRTQSTLEVDPNLVTEWMRSSEDLHQYEQRLLAGVPHLSLTYEEHMRDPDAHQKTVNSICEYLNVESAPVEAPYRKLAPRSLKEGIANYEELADHLGDTPYAKYLEE